MTDLLRELAARPELALVPVVAVVISVISVALARRSGTTGRRSLRLAERQELRREANLQIRYVSASCDIGETVRIYVFDLVVRNPSDRANSVAEGELWLDYLVEGESIAIKVPWKPAAGSYPAGALVLPVSLSANSTVAGSMRLEVSNELLAGRKVDRLRLVLTDTFDSEYVIPAEFVQERITEGDPEVG